MRLFPVKRVVRTKAQWLCTWPSKVSIFTEHTEILSAGVRGEAEGQGRRGAKARNGVGKRKRRGGSKRANGAGRQHAATANGAAAMATGVRTEPWLPLSSLLGLLQTSRPAGVLLHGQHA